MSDYRAASGPDEPSEPAGLWGHVRQGMRASRDLVRIARRDPEHIPERLALFAVGRYAVESRLWAQGAAARPESSPAVLADIERRRTISIARIDGTISGTPFLIALVPAYVAFLLQEVRFMLRTAALYGHDPADPKIPAEFLVLRGAHKDVEEASAALERVRATPLPAGGERAPLMTWYQAVLRIMILTGFMGPPEEKSGKPSRRERFVGAVGFVVASFVFVLTCVVPITFMIFMAWACEKDARRFGERVLTHYGNEGDDLAVAIARADSKSGSSRAGRYTRGALVTLSVVVPLLFIAASVFHGPLGLDLPRAAAALLALSIVIGLGAVASRA